MVSFFNSKIFEGTIIDCELVKDYSGKYQLQTFDMLFRSGNNLTNYFYQQRYAELEIFQKEFQYGKMKDNYF